MSKYPHVPMSNIQSKVDIVQKYFYDAIAVSFGQFTRVPLSKAALFYDSNAIFEVYNKKGSYVLYNVNGEMHCFLPVAHFYTAGTKGPWNGSADGQPRLAEWTSQMTSKA